MDETPPFRSCNPGVAIRVGASPRRSDKSFLLLGLPDGDGPRASGAHLAHPTVCAILIVEDDRDLSALLAALAEERGR
jgi:hypothetical protein